MLLEKLFKITETEIVSIEYLIEKLSIRNKKCYKCKSMFIIDVNNKTFRCYNRNCQYKVSLFKNTYFYNIHIKINKYLQIIYLYIHKVSVSNIIKMTGISSETACKITNEIRQLLSDSVKLSDVIIGSKNIIVEVDETKLGKRKYNKGHHVEGIWVIAGIERT